MDITNYTILLEKSLIIVGGEDDNTQKTTEQTTNSTSTGVPSALPAPSAEPTNILYMVGAYAVIIAALWFFMIRPQRKREKQAREMQEGIRPGDNVVTSGGLFGKVMDVGEDSFIIEFGTNRGIRVPVRKSDVLGVREPKLTPPPVAKE